MKLFVVLFALFIYSVSSFSGTVPPTCNAYADYGCTMFADKDGLNVTTEVGRGGTAWNGNNPERWARNVTWEDELCYVVEPGGQYCPQDDGGQVMGEDTEPNCKCRMNCIDAAPGIMPWAGRPEHRADLYRLSVKQGYDFFIPGRTTILQLDTLELGYNFRGLVMYAVSGNNDPMANSTDVFNEERVGSWDVPEDDIYFYVTPSDASEDCRNIVMHLAAAEKPLTTYFRFTAPADAPEAITFRVLIKTGNANTGNFYRPNSEDFSLRRGTDSDLQNANSNFNSGITYVRSEAGENCNDACSTVSKKCNAGWTNDVESEEAMDAVRADVACSYPSFALCDSQSPAALNEDPSQCYYRDPDSCNAAETTCEESYSGDISHRICACGSSGFRLSAGNFGFLVALVALFSFGTSKKNALVFFVALALVFALVPQASAHNWIFSDSRASGSASVVFPCQPARSSKPNVQVSRMDAGDEQNFAIEWATGHGSFVYFALVSTDDETMLRQHSTTVFNNYLNEGGRNMINDQVNGDYVYWKQHRYYTGGTPSASYMQNAALDQTAGVDGNGFNDAGTPIIGRSVEPATWQSEFIPKIDNCTTVDRGEYVGLKYTSNAVNQDMNGDTSNGDKVVVGWDSEAYPWIKGVWKYEIEQGFSGGRMDVANFWIPNKYPIGKYVIHYFWNGFFDCVDVDMIDHPGGSVETSSPCGRRPEDEYDEARVDHCLFPEPDAFFGPAMQLVDGDVGPCISRCLRHREAGCIGVLTFPMFAPSPVPADHNDYFLENWARLSLTPEDWIGYIRADRQAIKDIIPIEEAQRGRSPFCRNGGIDTDGDRLCNFLDLHYDLYNTTARNKAYSDRLRGNLEAAYQSAYDNRNDADNTFPTMWCAAVKQRFKTNTKDTQITTDDPRNPAFYSSCISVTDRVTFDLPGPNGENYGASTFGGEFGDYKFLDQCLDCTNRRRNAEPIPDPYWRFTDKCYNCDVVDSGMNVSTENLGRTYPYDMKVRVPNYRCTTATSWDSSINTAGNNLTSTDFNPAGITCPQPNEFGNDWIDYQTCTIKLGTYILDPNEPVVANKAQYGIPGWTPSDTTYQRRVCAHLASLDDRCDTNAIWIDETRYRDSQTSFNGGGTGGLEAGYFTDYGCRCGIRSDLKACCGSCSEDPTRKTGNTGGRPYDIYSLAASPALPGGNCSNGEGVYGDAGNGNFVCCENSCATPMGCDTGNNDAGTNDQANSRWSPDGAYCDSDTLYSGLNKNREANLCSVRSPPCIVG